MRTKEEYQKALDDIKLLIKCYSCDTKVWESIPFSVSKLQELIDNLKESE